MCGVCDNVEFIRARDGDDAARSFAKRAVIAYRKRALLMKGQVLRPQLLATYITAKRHASRS